MSYIRSRTTQLGVDPDFHSTKDVHISSHSWSTSLAQIDGMSSGPGSSRDLARYLRTGHRQGYAKVSKQERDRWGRLIEAWFADTQRMALGILIVDARHKPTADDCTMAQVFLSAEKPFLVPGTAFDQLRSS